ncbi:hypothetical protein BC937DRAFT_88212 [Endogone sp. FLAS-F59071]|nr:hypothetical protein BC937DRAFT_88212 [Endogone sp. FLAS-F59071]|eukprot:RUS18879.1 hypothetical protein BC937DRAFT_88212 [Endogone sp. FLAS-F59071]
MLLFVLLASAVLLFVYSAPVNTITAGPRAEGCAFTYNNRFYILAGNKSDVSLFMYTTFPLQLSTQESISWSIASVNDLFANMTAQDATTQNSYLRPCVVTPNGTLLVGGNNFYAYDIYNDRWLGTLNMTGSVANPNALISCSYSISCTQRIVIVEDSLWIFEDVVAISQPPTSNIYILNLTSYSWSTRQALNNNTANLPPNMKAPSLAYVSAAQLANVTNTTTGGVIFMFGGDDSGSVQNGTTATSTIWMFDIASSMWHLAATSLVEPRTDCTTFFYPPKNQLLIFPGAINGTSTGMTNVLEVLNLKQEPSALLGIGMTVTATNQVMSNQPEPLWDPNYVQQGDSIILYGGWLGGNSSFNSDQITNSFYCTIFQFFIYNMTQSQWTTNATTTPFTAPIEPTSAQSSSEQQNNTGPVVGGVIGGLAVCAIAAFVVIFLLRKRRGTRHVPESRDAPHTSDHHIYSPPHAVEKHLPHTLVSDDIMENDMGGVKFEKPGEVEEDAEWPFKKEVSSE